MPNTRTLTFDLKVISFLIIGDGGTGKTRFLGSCPKPYIFDFDKGIQSLRGKDVEYDTFKEYPKGYMVPAKRAEGMYAYGTAWPAFIAKLNEIGATIDKGSCPFQTLGFDSLTTLSNIALSWVLNNAGRDAPQIQDWGAQIRALETVVDQLTAWPLIKVMTAHIQRDTNAITDSIEQLPLVTGKFAGKVSVYFDEVYYATPIRAPRADTKYLFKTKADNVTKQAKSRLGVPDQTEASWEAVAKSLASSTPSLPLSVVGSSSALS